MMWTKAKHRIACLPRPRYRRALRIYWRTTALPAAGGPWRVFRGCGPAVDASLRNSEMTWINDVMALISDPQHPVTAASVAVVGAGPVGVGVVERLLANAPLLPPHRPVDIFLVDPH